ncbi:MAG TPA: hypothetical protein VMK84_12080, partial [Streptosporangiaceae bacterium]|nr:hypothetical protein [Streptosporangiaceae bacterium]
WKITISSTEQELGSLARAGDMQALPGLIERCRPSLYATAIGLLGNRADALDPFSAPPGVMV